MFGQALEPCQELDSWLFLYGVYPWKSPIFGVQGISGHLHIIFCYSHKTWFHQCNNKLPCQPNGLGIPTNKEGRTCSKLTARKRRCLYIHKLHVCHVHGHPYFFIAISGRNLGEQGPLWRTILPSSQWIANCDDGATGWWSGVPKPPGTHVGCSTFFFKLKPA